MLYKEIGDTVTKDYVKDYLNLYPSLLNPFGQHDESKVSKLFDNMGDGVRSIFFSIGASLSVVMLTYNVWYNILIYIFFSVLYFLFSSELVKREKNDNVLVSSENIRFRLFFLIVFQVIYIILYLAYLPNPF